MRKNITILLTCCGIAIWSAPISAQPTGPMISAQAETFCYDGLTRNYCVRTSEPRYEQCANLAVDRGWARRGTRGFDRFVYECLTGTIGTDPSLSTAPSRP